MFKSIFNSFRIKSIIDQTLCVIILPSKSAAWLYKAWFDYNVTLTVQANKQSRIRPNNEIIYSVVIENSPFAASLK